MNAENSPINPTSQQLIAKYFGVMARHYAAAYHLGGLPPETVRHDAAERFTQFESKTPRRAVDSILQALDAWRAVVEVRTNRAA